MLPTVVSETMHKLCTSLHTHLGENLESVYIYGSTALGAYIEGSSDIDFIALVRRPLSPSDLEAIAQAHAEVERAIPGTDIMGSYIRREDLDKFYADIPIYATYYNHQINTNGAGADINPVTLYVLQKYGVCVYGEDIPFTYITSINELLAYVLGNMNTYWLSWISRLENNMTTIPTANPIAIEQLNEAVEWCTLGMLRQLYTLKEHDITSKIGAGEYGLTILPERWHPLIKEAIAIKRRQHLPSAYATQTTRLQDLVELLRYIHTACNQPTIN